MTIEVYSFDFDGCLFNPHYLDSEKKDVIKSNKALLNLIKQSKNEKIVFIGSNRQSIQDDHYNSRKGTESCFAAIIQVNKEIKGVLNTFVMTDLYNNLQNGDTFKQALIQLNKKSFYGEVKLNADSNAEWLHDKSKLTILYAQMHQVALEHPNEEIEFHFYDDREDILNGLHQYLKQYTDLIPPNITLNLHQYIGPFDKDGTLCNPLVKHLEVIKGSAQTPDAEYKSFVKNIAAATLEQTEGIVSSHACFEIKNYLSAQAVFFSTSAINCIKQYIPGMQAKYPIEDSYTQEESCSSSTTSADKKTPFSFLSRRRSKLERSISTSPPIAHSSVLVASTINAHSDEEALQSNSNKPKKSSSQPPSRSPSPPSEGFFGSLARKISRRSSNRSPATNNINSKPTLATIPEESEDNSENSMGSALTCSTERSI